MLVLPISKENLVEVPLDPRYITDEGMYVAGYIWGSHVRSPKDLPKGFTEDFKKGAEDGYGDFMLKWEAEVEKIKSEREAGRHS